MSKVEMKKVACGTGVGNVQLQLNGHIFEVSGGRVSVIASELDFWKGLGAKSKPTQPRYKLWAWVTLPKDLYQPIYYYGGTPECDGRQAFLIREDVDVYQSCFIR